MLIRKAKYLDFAALVQIGHKFFEFNPHREFTDIDEESLIQTFEQLLREHLLLVVEVEDKVVGTAAAFIAPLYWNFGFLQGVEAFWWIDPEHRGNKAGTRLRVALQQAAKDKGVTFWSMIALADSMHDQVCAVYKRAGFKHAESVYMKVL
jgi:L-amino acid N-acyltransferase YncA